RCLAAALEGNPVVKFNPAAKLKTKICRALLDDMRQFSVTQQRLRRDTADVQADTAPPLFLDDGSLQPKLRTPDCTHVSARPRAEDDHIIVFRHSWLLIEYRETQIKSVVRLYMLRAVQPMMVASAPRRGLE